MTRPLRSIFCMQSHLCAFRLSESETTKRTRGKKSITRHLASSPSPSSRRPEGRTHSLNSDARGFRQSKTKVRPWDRFRACGDPAGHANSCTHNQNETRPKDFGAGLILAYEPAGRWSAAGERRVRVRTSRAACSLCECSDSILTSHCTPLAPLRSPIL
jgi:hypothetical protein